MIGKPEWFKRRKYGGWGITPDTWQGRVYIAAVLIPFAAFHALPYWDTQTRLIVTFAWLAFLFLDTMHIMLYLNKDEREERIEALSERNAAWVMALILVFGVFYELLTSALRQQISVDPFLVAALFGGLIAKSVSNFYLERKAL